MIHIIDCGFWEFSGIATEKRVYCFGAGKQLRAFVESNPNVEVTGVIDNYRWMDMDHITVGEKNIKVLSVEQFVQEYDGLCVVVITCPAYEEIIDQLDQIAELDGLDCYLDLFLEQYTEHFDKYPVSDRKENVIPKRIHYCWFGGGKLPEEYRKCMESWKGYCPDYEVIRWDESNYDISKNRYMKQAYEQKKWAFVSDYARVDVIYQYGGIYLDTDVELCASFDEFLKWDMFCGFEAPKAVNWGLGFGAVKGLGLLKDVLDEYGLRDFIKQDGSMDLTACPVLQSAVMKKYGFRMDGRPQQSGNTAIYPKEFFAPFTHMAGFGRRTVHTHSIHHYAASWLSADTKREFHKWEPLICKVRNHERYGAEDRYYAEKNKISKIKRFQIRENESSTDTAGGKAPADISVIAGNAGYELIVIHPVKGAEGTDTYLWSKRQNDMDWEACYDRIPPDSLLLLQHPFWQTQEMREPILERLKREKEVSIISLVHDVEQLRGIFNQPHMRREFEFMLRIADVLIVHNRAMEEFFLRLGVRREKIVRLQVFDYLFQSLEVGREFTPSIVIAGNMDPMKSNYIRKLSGLMGVKIHLFGPNYLEEEPCGHIEYHGTYSAEQLPCYLEGSFGLVWDGDSLETCSGETGNYLRFNSPHKLSLYLSADIPVIIWREAAQAKFVEENGIGILVDSLYEIPDRLLGMTGEEYQKYVDAVAVLSPQIRNGEYTRTALGNAEIYISKRN